MSISRLGVNLRAALRDLVTPPGGNLPALDVLRSVAILMVICYHFSMEFVLRSGLDNSFARFPLVTGGWRGVDLFFVLSGYLIGRQLWREIRETGTLSLRRFMIRRGFRIWPLYYVAIAIWIVGSTEGRAKFPHGYWWTDAVFLSNYFPDQLMPGSWSLSVEEQFYLIAPLLVLALGRTLRAGGTRAGLPWLIGLLLILPVVRLLTLLSVSTEGLSQSKIFNRYFYTPIHLHADSLVMGLLLANLADGRRPDRPARAAVLVVVAAIFAVVGRKLSQPIFEASGTAVLFGAMVWLALSLRNATAPFFGSRVFFILSRLSFGIYLFHQLVMEWAMPAAIRLVRSASLPSTLADISVSIALTIASAAFATVTYCLIEWPFLNIRDRLLHRPSGPEPGTPKG